MSARNLGTPSELCEDVTRRRRERFDAQRTIQIPDWHLGRKIHDALEAPSLMRWAHAKAELPEIGKRLRRRDRLELNLVLRAPEEKEASNWDWAAIAAALDVKCIASAVLTAVEPACEVNVDVRRYVIAKTQSCRAGNHRGTTRNAHTREILGKDPVSELREARGKRAFAVSLRRHEENRLAVDFNGRRV